MKCNRCDHTALKLNEYFQCFSNKDTHVRGECPNCETWVKWVAYAESDLVKRAIAEYIENHPDTQESYGK